VEVLVRQKKTYSVEFREQAVRLVIDNSRPVVDVANEIGVHEGTLSNWVRIYRDEHPVAEKPLTMSERTRLQELEREVRELRMKTEFLGKAAAFFAQEYR
jgi:transposase